MITSPLIRGSWRTHYKFLFSFYLNTFCTSLFSTYLITSSKSSSLSTQILAYSLGQIIGSLALGMSRDFISTKHALLLSILFGALSGFLGLFYIIFPFIDYFYLIELVKFIAGVWNGGLMAVEQAYVSEVVADVDKLKVLSEIGLFDMIASALGMIVQGISQELLEFDLALYASLELALAGFTFVFTSFMFTEFTVDKRANRTRSYKDYEKPAILGIVVCFAFALVFYYTKTIQFFMLLKEVEETYVNSILEVFLSGLALYFIVFLHKFIEEEKTILMIFSLICAAGWCFLIDFRFTSSFLYYIGFFTTTTGFAVCRCCIFVIMSKIIGPYPAGLYFGALISIGEIGSILTIFEGSELLYSSSYLVQVICVGSILAVSLLLVLCWDKCSPHYLNKKYSKVILNLETPMLSLERIPSHPFYTDMSYASVRYS